MRVSLIWAGVVTGILAGCAAQRPEPGIVAKNWSENTQQLGIQAVFPPRGNISVGDVYIARTTKAGGKTLASFYASPAQWYDHIDLLAEVEAAAPPFEASKMSQYDDGQGMGAKKSWPLPEMKRPGGTKRVNSLVAFPGFTFASMAENQIGINVTEGIVKALLSGGRKSSYSVAFSVPAAEVYGVPYLAAKAKFQAVSRAYDQGDLTPFSTSASEPGVFVLITEVYSARAIDVAVSSQEGFGVTVSAAVAQLAELSGKSAETAQEIVTTQAQPATAAQADKLVALNTTQAGIQAQMRTLSESIVPQLPGVTGSVVRTSSNGVTLRQVFELPVVIGYRGVNFKLSDLVSQGSLPAGSSPPNYWPSIYPCTFRTHYATSERACEVQNSRRLGYWGAPISKFR